MGQKGLKKMLDSNKLKGKIAEAGLTQRELAKKAGMSENSLYNKINGRRDFGAREIVAICEILNITDNEQKALIFLN